ncbi:hypothetical protein ACQ86N_27015 [Puia sp. P3]|uniref:hypothetical protein n=1 Tax=Puia sp. P3 TaxID=3423952 RepID=UPI003D66F187
MPHFISPQASSSSPTPSASFRSEETHNLYFWCQLMISLDIFLLVLAGKDALRQMPRVNLFFRIVEIIFFLGIGTIMLMQGHIGIAIVHHSLAIAYSYLFYCERRLRADELLSFHHTGITIPGLPESRFLLWSHINDVETSLELHPHLQLPKAKVSASTSATTSNSAKWKTSTSSAASTLGK